MFGRTAITAIFVLAVCALLAPSLKEQGLVDAAKSTTVKTDSNEPAPAETARATPSVTSTELARDYDGHFRTSVRVNGTDMLMMIDSGASVVVLGEAQARAAGIFVDPAAFTGTAKTAGGDVATMPVILDRISIGGIERTHVQAAVIRGDLPQPLLGQSFLATLNGMDVDGNRMVLR